MDKHGHIRQHGTRQALSNVRLPHTAYHEILLKTMACKEYAQLLQVGQTAKIVYLPCLHWTPEAVNVQPHKLAEARQMDQVIWPHYWSTVADVQILQVVPQCPKQ